MFISDNGNSGSFEQAPVGTHLARCIKLIDIGTHKGEYQGQATIKRQIIAGWELPMELISSGDYAGKPFTCSRFYTASLNEKSTLRADLKNWRTRDFTEDELKKFDLRSILGKVCMVSLTHTDKNKVKVSGVMAAPKGMAAPEQVGDTVYLSLEPELFDQDVFDSLSDGYKKLIMQSPEYKQLTAPPMQQQSDSAGFDDEIPF